VITNNYGKDFNKCAIKLASNLSNTKPKYTRLNYVHRQLMLNMKNNYVIERSITSSIRDIAK
jgi:hypothetical protein